MVSLLLSGGSWEEGNNLVLSTETTSHSRNYRYQHSVFSRNHLELPDPFCSGGITAVHSPPPYSEQQQQKTKSVFTPLTKQLQGHEGEHEKAKDEKQEDIGDLWQCVADAAEGSSNLSGTMELFRSSTHFSYHHPIRTEHLHGDRQAQWDTGPCQLPGRKDSDCMTSS